MIPKFRFFGKVDDRNERMVRADSIDFENGYIYYSYRQFTVEGDDHVYGDVIGFEDCVLMRSTGLFDVNGKEIFEGDVVRLDSRYIMVVKYGRHYIECKPNAYRGIGFFLITKDLPNPKYPVFPDGEYEVIGNVHQNPELMEATND